MATAEFDTREALEFSAAKQAAVLGHMATDERFWARLGPHVRDWWFADPWCQKWCSALQNFFSRYKRLPTRLEARELPEVRDEADQAFRQRMLDVLEEAFVRTSDFRQDALVDEMIGWWRAILLKSTVEKVGNLYNAKKVREAETTLESWRQTAAEVRFERDPELNWTKFADHFKKQEQELDHALTWGNSTFDMCLCPLAKSGSLLPSQTTLVIAPTGRGKTTTMYNVVAPNVLAGEPSIVFTHEGESSDHHLKIWCILLGLRPHEVLSMYQTSDGVEVMRQLAAYLYDEKHLTFVPMQRAGQTVEEVLDIARRKQDQRLAKFGKGYRLFVSDYPACLSSSAAMASRWEYRHLRRYVFDQLVDLALEMEWHCLAAAQGHRDSSKAMKGRSKEDDGSGRIRLVTKEDIGEAWGPCERTNNAVVIQRTPAAETQGWVAYLIDKTRTNDTGRVVVCRSDFSRYRTHSEELGASWYRSSGTLANRLSELLDQYKGGAIPEEDMVE